MCCVALCCVVISQALTSQARPAFCIKEDVLQLDVSVDHTSSVHGVHSAEQRHGKLGGVGVGVGSQQNGTRLGRMCFGREGEWGDWEDESEMVATSLGWVVGYAGVLGEKFGEICSWQAAWDGTLAVQHEHDGGWQGKTTVPTTIAPVELASCYKFLASMSNPCCPSCMQPYAILH